MDALKIFKKAETLSPDNKGTHWGGKTKISVDSGLDVVRGRGMDRLGQGWGYCLCRCRESLSCRVKGTAICELIPFTPTVCRFTSNKPRLWFLSLFRELEGTTSRLASTRALDDFCLRCKGVSVTWGAVKSLRRWEKEQEIYIFKQLTPQN